MKKYIAIFCALLMMLGAAAAEGFTYTVTSVPGCEQSAAYYNRFYQCGTRSVIIPGLAEGLVPQGICWLPEEDCFLFAGYREDKENSALIAVDRSTQQVIKEVFLLNTDGSMYSGHAGGVCATDTDIYVSNNHQLLRISLDTFRALPLSAECRFEENIPVPVNSSYCCYADGVLWVGEFQYGGSYTTHYTHRVKTADGYQRAWTCGYDLRNGCDFSAPDYVLSMTERIQGITAANDSIYLSQSYGRRADSVLYRYEDVLQKDPSQIVNVDGAQVPLWILDSRVLRDRLTCPPMSECICTIDGAVYVLFESAAGMYRDPSNPSLNPMDQVFCLTGF